MQVSANITDITDVQRGASETDSEGAGCGKCGELTPLRTFDRLDRR
jgi:hypothetical protein